MSPSTFRFTRVVLKNWKNFKSVDVELARRAFLVGPNATGKSNFLDAIRFLRDLATDGGGLAQAVDKWRGGVSHVRSLFARQNPNVEIQVEIRSDEGNGFRYVLVFNSRTKRDQTPIVLREAVEKITADGKIETLLDRPDKADRRDSERLTQTAIQQVTANKNFREMVAFFDSITYLHLVPQLLREEQLPRRSGKSPDQFGRDLLNQIKDVTPRTRTARLKRIGAILKIVVPQLESLDFEIDQDGRPRLFANFRHWRQYGAKQYEVQFSDGTLRLIGLLWSLQERAGPLLLEEPELSLHTAIVRQMAPFIYRAQRSRSGRQVILSTHSEQILQDDGVAPEEVLLVRPVHEGSEIVVGAQIPEVANLMAAGFTAHETISPRTVTDQMSLFSGADL
ncbi:MAG: AAA family ATPase [Deltaproteobacteria bacterium]|nr:AAA family ATPase [Deltaproteobacteria bacterium]